MSAKGSVFVRISDAQHNLILHELERLATSGEYWGNRLAFDQRLGDLIAMMKTGSFYWKAKA